MRSHVGYPEQILDKDLMNKFYSDLDLKTDKGFLLKILTLNKFYTGFRAAQFRLPIDKNDWRTHGLVAIVNAYYDPAENSIIVPAAVLTGVFYQEDRNHKPDIAIQ